MFLSSRVRSGAQLAAVAALAGLNACASATPKPSTDPKPSGSQADWARDPRNNMKAGLFDAQELASNLRVTAKAVSPPGFLGITNSDLAFTGKYAIQGNYNGPVIWDISDPAKPVLVTAYSCPASQNDISVYRNLLFMSAEANNGRTDCMPGGVQETVSPIRMRGVRVFDISDIKTPKLVANVQTCRGSHTHTVLEDPKDKANVYIYVSGSAGIRPAAELAGCAGDVASDDPNSSRLRIEIIKVPLSDPSRAAVVGRANIFAGLSDVPRHGLSDADKEQQATQLAAARARGAFIARNPQSGMDMVVPPQLVRPVLDSIAKLAGRTGATATAADSTAARGAVQGAMNRLFAAAPGGNPGAVSERSQCHDITVYPALGLAGGACEGHGLLLDISDPVNPRRLDAAADSNFAYWHSATFNNDGTKLLFSDEWGGGGAPKCRAGDKPEWGANAIFTIENRKLKFQSYYKIPSFQSANENCVAHNGSLIPIPGRDVMVQSWYQGGISVFDWSDPAKPFEIASFDRGPVDSTRMVLVQRQDREQRDRARPGRGRDGAEPVRVAERDRCGQDRAVGVPERTGSAEDRVAAVVRTGACLHGPDGTQGVLQQRSHRLDPFVVEHRREGLGGGARHDAAHAGNVAGGGDARRLRRQEGRDAEEVGAGPAAAGAVSQRFC
jgi:hypothetical protein